MIALCTHWYKFVRIYRTLRCNPTMAAGLSKPLWSMKDVIALVDARADVPKASEALQATRVEGVMMRGRSLVVVFVFVVTPAFANDVEKLARRGYGVLEQTCVVGEFKGCEFGLHVPLVNGLVFVCSGYSYHYAYGAEALIMKSVRSGDIKILIDNEEFDGQLYRQPGR